MGNGARRLAKRTLTGTSNREHDLRRMPSTDTSDLPETLVRLPGQLLGTPTVSNTLEAVTLRDRNDVDNLILLEDGSNLDGLLEQAMCELDLVRHGAAVDLDLHEVGLFLGETSLANLGVGEDTDNRAVLADTLKLTGDGLAVVLSVLLGVASERLLLGAVPVLVEAALELVRKMGGPDGGEGAKATGSLNVADNTNDDEGRGLDDGDGLNDLTFVHLCEIIGHCSFP